MDTYKENIDYENLNRLYLIDILEKDNIDLLREYIELNPNTLEKELNAFQESNPTIYETSDKEVVHKIETKMAELAEKIEEVENSLYYENADMTDDQIISIIKKKLNTSGIQIPEDIANHIANEYINYYKIKNYNKNKKFWQSTKMYKKKYMDTIKNKMVELRDSVINKFKSKQYILKLQNLSDEEKRKQLALENYDTGYGGKRKKRKSVKKKKNVKKRKNTKRKRI
jgi:hypothetical protein